MERCWRWFGPLCPLTHVRQAGTIGVITALHGRHHGEVWPEDAAAPRKADVEPAVPRRSVVDSGCLSSATKFGGSKAAPTVFVLAETARAGARHSIQSSSLRVTSNPVGRRPTPEVGPRFGVADMVCISSPSAYGESKVQPPPVEGRTDQPNSIHTATPSDGVTGKAYAESRLFTVHGCWGRPDTAMWSFPCITSAKKPMKTYKHSGTRRDFTFIDDNLKSIVVVLNHPPPDEGHLRAGSSRSHRMYSLDKGCLKVLYMPGPNGGSRLLSNARTTADTGQADLRIVHVLRTDRAPAS